MRETQVPENKPALTEATPPIPDRDTLRAMALAIMTGGELRRYLRGEPPWCGRAGTDVWCALLSRRREPDTVEIDLLLKAHARAAAKRDRQLELVRREQEYLAREAARRGQRRQPIPSNAGCADTLGKVGTK